MPVQIKPEFALEYKQKLLFLYYLFPILGLSEIEVK